MQAPEVQSLHLRSVRDERVGGRRSECRCVKAGVGRAWACECECGCACRNRKLSRSIRCCRPEPHLRTLPPLRHPGKHVRRLGRTYFRDQERHLQHSHCFIASEPSPLHRRTCQSGSQAHFVRHMINTAAWTYPRASCPSLHSWNHDEMLNQPPRRACPLEIVSQAFDPRALDYVHLLANELNVLSME